MSRDPARAPLPLPSPPPLAPPSDLAQRLGAIDVRLDDATLARIGGYLARLLAMNEQVNLTSITDPAEAWTRHAFDALTLLPHLAELPVGARVLDVGSGGGVPGIPLAIARPDLRFTLLEATEKKAAFLRAVSEALGLANVEVVAERAEQAAKGSLAASFDAVTARAVARLDTLLGWTAPFARTGGVLLLIKGARAPDELAEADMTPTGRVVVLRVT
jgi:16S rRNA (guanine527-N7)-methyltransferase